MSFVIATPPEGFDLADGTPTFLTYDVPDDGHPHFIAVFALQTISENLTGGAVDLSWTSGGLPATQNIIEADQPASPASSSLVNTCLVDPGSTIKVAQSSAMTAGAASLYIAFLILG